MAVKLLTAVRTSIMNEVKDAIDAGGAPAVIRIYTGSQPANPGAAATGTLLAENVLSYPCGTVTDGVLVFDAINEDEYANNTGTAAWARISTSAGQAVLDCSCSVAGGAGDLQLNTTNIVINGPIRYVALQITAPGA